MKKNIMVGTLFVLLFTSISTVYGHGLGTDTVGPKNVGDRLVTLVVKLDPEMMKAGTIQDETLSIRIFRINGSKSIPIPGIAVNLEIIRFKDNKLLLNQTFHVMSDEDNLEIAFKTTKEGNVTIDGLYMGSKLGYMRSPNNKMIVVQGPIFTQAGLYKINLIPIALDSEVLPSEQHTKFTALISLAEIKDHDVTYNGNKYTIQTISYHDSLTSLVFDEKNLTLKAFMPFDWSMVDQINLLHFEYYLPKGFVLADKELVGYINGVEQPIFIDRASEGWGAVIHYMISQKGLKELASKMHGEDLKRVVFEIRSKGSTVPEFNLVFITMTLAISVMISLYMLSRYKLKHLINKSY